MARSFDGSTQYADGGSNAATSYPVTLSAWFTVNASAAANMVLLTVGEPVSSRELQIYWQNADTTICARHKGDSAAVIVITGLSSVAKDDTWYHCAAVFVGGTERHVYLNGSKFSDATTDAGTCTFPNVGIGKILRAATQYWYGRIAECAVWSAQLSDAEIAILAAGYAPPLVRPGSLAHYYPVIGESSTEIDIVGGANLTLTGSPPRANHARVFYPASPIVGLAAAAAAPPETVTIDKYGAVLPQLRDLTRVGVSPY